MGIGTRANIDPMPWFIEAPRVVVIDPSVISCKAPALELQVLIQSGDRQAFNTILNSGLDTHDPILQGSEIHELLKELSTAFVTLYPERLGQGKTLR